MVHPVGLVVGDHAAEHLLQSPVQSFGLAVGLGMVGGGHGKLGAGEGEEGLPETTRELGVPVRDDGGGEAVVTVDVVEEELGGCGSIGGTCGRDEHGLLTKAIHDREYGVVTRGGGRKVGDKVH